MSARKDERACLPLARPFFLGPATQTSDLGKGAVVKKKKEGKEKREMNDNGGSLSFFALLFTA